MAKNMKEDEEMLKKLKHQRVLVEGSVDFSKASLAHSEMTIPRNSIMQ
jgi:hypothetical protein